jgi:hypothetical protein
MNADSDRSCKVCGWAEDAHETGGAPHRDAAGHPYTPEWQPRVRFPAAYPHSDGPWDIDDPKRSIFYLEVPSDDWTVVYGLMVQDGKLVIAEIRLQPTDTPGMYVTRPGEWSSDITEVPPNGITARQLRHVRPGEVWDHMPFVLERLRTQVGEDRFKSLFRSRGVPDEIIENLSPRTTYAKAFDRLTRLVHLAAAYVEEVQKGNKQPTRAVAERTGYSHNTVLVYISEARKKGLLTPAPGRGRPGGSLTQLAEELLETDQPGEP